MPREAHLIAGAAAGLQSLGVVPSTVELAILVEVDEIHQHVLAHAAHEAIWVPPFSVTRPGGKHHDVASLYLTTALGGRIEESKFH